MEQLSLLQIFISGAMATVLVAIINAVVNRRRIGAEATKFITDAAAGVVKDLNADNDRLRAENRAINEALSTNRTDVVRMKDRLRRAEHDMAELKRHSDKQTTMLQGHQHWDEMAAHLIRKAGIEIPDPPPLTLD